MLEPVVIPLRPVLIFVVVLARMGGLVTFAPFWSHRLAPGRARALLAMALAFIIAPVVAQRLPTPPSELLSFSVVIIGELLIGCALGFVGRLVFGALDMAAHVLGFQMGFSLAGTIDPSTRAQTAALGTVAQMLGLVLLLGADGHHWMLTATVRSYSVVGMGDFHMTAGLAALFIRLAAEALAVGVALAAPAIVVLLAVELALAVAGRAAPQLQIMVLGFPIKIAVGLWLIGASLYFMPAAIRASFDTMRGSLARALSLM
jgi:flagellar biosynthetic protein FliR